MLSIGGYLPDQTSAQEPADVAVVIATLARPAIRQALQSIYAQDFAGRVQLMVGVDVQEGSAEALVAALEERPANMSAVLLTLPYSTSVRHGGVHTPLDGGSLRAVLSLAANARRVAYLDDDNAWVSDHLSRLSWAIAGSAWAYSQRMLVAAEDDAELGVDLWHSAGPGKGEFAQIGGFVDTNCLLVDKREAASRFGAWADTLGGEPGHSSDKRFFLSLAKLPHARVEAATVRYRIRQGNRLRINVIEARGERAIAVPL